MGLYKAISVVALGVGSYALYKTGALKPVTKTVVKAGAKVSEWTEEAVSNVKEGYKNLRKKEETPTDEVVSGELLTPER